MTQAVSELQQAWIQAITDRFRELKPRYNSEETSLEEKRQIAGDLRRLEAVSRAIRYDHAQRGVCIECGEAIPEARMQASPCTGWCLTCAAQQPTDGRGAGGGGSGGAGGLDFYDKT